jgi:hypothetical protein
LEYYPFRFVRETDDAALIETESQRRIIAKRACTRQYKLHDDRAR